MSTYYASTGKRQEDDVSGQPKSVNVRSFLHHRICRYIKRHKYPSDKNTILNSVIGRTTDKKISELLGQIEDKLCNNSSEVATATGLVERE